MAKLTLNSLRLTFNDSIGLKVFADEPTPMQDLLVLVSSVEDFSGLAPVGRLATRSASSDVVSLDFTENAEPAVAAEIVYSEVLSGSFSGGSLTSNVTLSSLPTFSDQPDLDFGGSPLNLTRLGTQTHVQAFVVLLFDEPLDGSTLFDVTIGSPQVLNTPAQTNVLNSFDITELVTDQEGRFGLGPIIAPTSTQVTVTRSTNADGDFNFKLAVFIADRATTSTSAFGDLGNGPNQNIDADPTLDVSMNQDNFFPNGGIAFTFAGRQESSFLNTTTVSTDGPAYGSFLTMSNATGTLVDDGIKVGYALNQDRAVNPESIQWTFSDSGVVGERGKAAAMRIGAIKPEQATGIIYNSSEGVFVQSLSRISSSANTSCIRTSDDGVAWTPLDSTPSPGSTGLGFCGIHYVRTLDRTIVGVQGFFSAPIDASDLIWYSDDLVTWTTSTLNTVNGPIDSTLKFASHPTNGEVLVTSDHSYVWYSADGGANFDEYTDDLASELFITYLVSEWFPTLNAFVLMPTYTDNFIVFNPGGSPSFDYRRVSTDALFVYWVAIKYIESMNTLVAVGIDYDTFSTLYVAYTTTGAVDGWTLVDLTAQTGAVGSNPYVFIEEAGDRVVIAVDDGVVASSEDLTTWDTHSAPNFIWSGIALGQVPVIEL